jgi:Chlorophyll A-B binding protein
LAEKLNPVLKYFDPLDVTATSPWGFTNEQTIGWYRHSEIKHGRVAMMAFVGYVVQSNFHFPWALTLDGTPHPSVDLSPPEQWDALPFESKLQIILFIGFLEFYSELTPSASSKSALPHYVNGGVPGKYPTFEDVPHPVPFNLYDPFGLSKKRSPEAKARGLVSEINNGRLAMLGIMYVGNARCSCVGNFGRSFLSPSPFLPSAAVSLAQPPRSAPSSAASCANKPSRGPFLFSPASSSRTRAKSWRPSRPTLCCR